MAYMIADTSAKVGYRPYGVATDPQAAAMLSGVPHDDGGLGEYLMNRPLDPWELPDVHHLRGLGRNEFHAQAWHLHGLGAAVDVTQQAADELLAAGHITQAEHDAILEGSMDFVDVLGYDPTDQSSWANLTSLFQEVNHDLQALEQAFQTAGPQPGNATWAQLGQQLIAQRNQYTSYAAQFSRLYTLVMGSTPPGLSGLGIAPIIWVAGAAVFIVSAFIALYAIRTWSQSVNVNAIKAQTAQTTAVSTASTNQNLLTALAAAQASGDTITAQSILKTLQTTGAQPAAPSTMEAWLMNNWQYLVLGAGALIAIGPISSGLFGGKRR